MWRVLLSVRLQVFKRVPITNPKMSSNVSFYVNYRSFLVSKKLVLNMDDYIGTVDYSGYTCEEVDIYNHHTQTHLLAKVAFIPSMGDDNLFILTNVLNVKYDPFDVACIVRHFEKPGFGFKHHAAMSLKDMYDFIYNVNADDTCITSDLTKDSGLKSYVYNKRTQAQQAQAQQAQAQAQAPAQAQQTNEYLKALHAYVQHQANAHQAHAHHVQHQAYAHQAYADYINEQAQQTQAQHTEGVQVQQSIRQTPSQELSHYQSKKNARKMMETPNSNIGRQKFRRLFEDAIREEPELHINRTIDDYTVPNYGPIPLTPFNLFTETRQ